MISLWTYEPWNFESCKVFGKTVKKNIQIFHYQLTASLVKPLAFPRPGGHNLILEWDIFYPLPDTWRKPKKPTPPPPPTTTEVIETWDPHSGHSGEIWMPDGGWDSDVIKTLSSGDEKPAEKRTWNPPRAPQVI